MLRLSYVVQRTVVAFTLLCVAAATFFVLWRQQQRTTATHAKTQAATRLFSFADPNAISQLVVTHPQAGTVEISRDSAAPHIWHITSPRAVLAEATTIEAMLRSAFDLRALQTIVPTQLGPDGAPELALFGLAPPRYTLTLTGHVAEETGPVTQSLAIGAKSIFDGNLYAQRLGATAVALIPAAFAYQVDRDLYTLRDKRAAVFAPNSVETLTLAATAFGPGYHIKRAAGGFELVAPLQVRADRDAVNSLLTALATVRGKRVVAEDASQAHLSLFGLQQPRFDVTLQLYGGDLIRLLFGEIQLQGVTHAFVHQAAADAPIWEIDADGLLQKLRQEAAQLRDMHVVHVDAQQVYRISMHQEGIHMTLVKESDPQHDDLRWVMPQAPARKVRSSHVATLVHKVAQLKAEKIVAEQATPERLKALQLHQPVFEIDLLDAGEHLLGSLLLGSQTADGVYATTDQKLRLDQIAVSDGDAIMQPLDSYFDDAQPAGKTAWTP